MRQNDPQIARVIESLSRLLGRDLHLVDATTETDAVVLSKTLSGSGHFAIRDNDEKPFTEGERHALRSIVDLICDDVQLKNEMATLDQRVRLVEKENVELSMKNRALADVSSRDVLTGLYTRWYVMDKIEAELNRALRHGSQMSLLMMDIDHFRQVNETYGHQAGDHVLQTIGHVIKDSCRVYDVPGRYGGEEFCLMLPEIKIDRTIPVAERIRRRVEETVIPANGHSIRVTISVGIAALESVPGEAVFGAGSLIDRADRALYQAKERGRNRAELWSPVLATRVPLTEQGLVRG